MRYLKGTIDIGFTFSIEKLSESIVGYVDSDYAGYLDKRRSLAWYACTLSNSIISQDASLQSIVALSITKAEYMVIAEAMKEDIWIQGVVSDFGLFQQKILVFCDS